jgi:hypothetical protein
MFDTRRILFLSTPVIEQGYIAIKPFKMAIKNKNLIIEGMKTV